MSLCQKNSDSLKYWQINFTCFYLNIKTLFCGTMIKLKQTLSSRRIETFFHTLNILSKVYRKNRCSNNWSWKNLKSQIKAGSTKAYYIVIAKNATYSWTSNWKMISIKNIIFKKIRAKSHLGKFGEYF